MTRTLAVHLDLYGRYHYTYDDIRPKFTNDWRFSVHAFPCAAVSIILILVLLFVCLCSACHIITTVQTLTGSVASHGAWCLRFIGGWRIAISFGSVLLNTGSVLFDTWRFLLFACSFLFDACTNQVCI